MVTLLIPPYTFRRKTNFKKIESRDHFYCSGCEKQGRNTKAYCVLKSLTDDKPEYILDAEPSIDEHKCAPSPVEHLAKLFSKR